VVTLRVKPEEMKAGLQALESRHVVTLCVFSLGHPPWKKQLMKIEQVVETSAQPINGRHGEGQKQSAHGTPMDSFPAEAMSSEAVSDKKLHVQSEGRSCTRKALNEVAQLPSWGQGGEFL
jgi:hypothetical protein